VSTEQPFPDVDEPEVLDPADLPDDVDDFDPCEDVDPDAVTAFGLVGPGQHPATWIERQFKEWGVKYRVVAGWQTRGRPPSSGGFNPKGVLIHHTGSTSSATNPNGALRTVTDGRSDLPGPLCQVSTGYDGVTTIVAAGRANHAGRMKALGKIPAGDGNTQLIGNEVQTSGTQQMPKAQYDAVIRSTAAILDAPEMGGATVAELGLHATTSYEGKWDLGAGNGKSGVPYSLTTIRNDVAALLKAGPNSKEDDMPLTDDDAKLILTGAAVMKNPFATNPDTAPRVAASYVLEQTAAKAAAAAAQAIVASRDIVAVAKAVAEVKAQVAKIAPAQPTVVTDEQLERVLRKVIGSVDS